MAADIQQDIDLGIARLEYGDPDRPQKAVLTISTRKHYNRGLISTATVFWLGNPCRSTVICLAGSGGDYSQHLKYDHTLRATQGNINAQHATVFTPETIARLTQAAKDHYAANVRAGVDGFRNTYPLAVSA